MLPPRTTNNDLICKYGYQPHVTVRCSGCNGMWRTKNIGWRNENAPFEVVNARTMFVAFSGAGCICSDYQEYPLVHEHGVDCDFKGDN